MSRKFLLSTALTVLAAASTSLWAQDRMQSGARSAPKAVGDPLQTLYIIPGVTDDGGAANTGVATTFICHNYGTAEETIRFIIRNFDDAVVANDARPIGPRETLTASTHGTVVLSEDLSLVVSDAVTQGSATIRATSINIVCTAMVLDAGASIPTGIALHAVRLNPKANAQEDAKGGSGPSQTLYIIPGIHDDGSGVAETGVATSIHCYNYGNIAEGIRIIVRDRDAQVLADESFAIQPRNVRTVSTKFTAAFREDLQFELSEAVNQGTALVRATGVDIVCTAMIVDAAAPNPVGIALHGVRFNPRENTQE